MLVIHKYQRRLPSVRRADNKWQPYRLELITGLEMRNMLLIQYLFCLMSNLLQVAYSHWLRDLNRVLVPYAL